MAHDESEKGDGEELEGADPGLHIGDVRLGGRTLNAGPSLEEGDFLASPLRELLLQITHCPEVVKCRGGLRDHPCAKVVSVQEAVPLERHQVPEPWSGQLAIAPILFIASNPSISAEELEEYPLWSEPADLRAEFFERRFGGGRAEWIRDGKRSLQKDGSYGGATQFWAKVRARAIELLGPNVRPGIDYALTEVVRCKSRGDYGVAEAMRKCPDLYLRQTVELAAARVIVVLGRTARRAVADIFGGPDWLSVYRFTIGGVERAFVSLGRPGASDPQKFAACLQEDEVDSLRALARH